MTERMDILAPVPGKDGKTYFTRIGTAWATKNGGWSLVFDALPVARTNDKGTVETRALMMPPKDRDQPAQRGNAGGGAPAFDPNSDDIPFAPEWRG